MLLWSVDTVGASDFIGQRTLSYMSFSDGLVLVLFSFLSFLLHYSKKNTKLIIFDIGCFRGSFSNSIKKKTSNSKNTSSSLRNKREYSQSKPSINKGFNHNSKNTSRKSRLSSNETVESKNSTRTKNKKSLASKHSKKKRFKKSRFSTKKTNLKSNFASNSQRNKNRRSKRSREK